MKIFSLVSAAVLLSFSSNVLAEDYLSALMQRMRSDKAVRIAYQEERILELMEQPWYGNGYMYSLPPDTMIKEQLQPKRLLMAVSGDRVYYFDPENNIRHQMEMEEDNPISLNIAVFKALINADEKLLHRLYQVDFSSDEQVWTMNLIPSSDQDSGFKISISGGVGKHPENIKVWQPDGDISILTLKPEPVIEGTKTEPIAEKVETLYQELQGE